MDFRFFGVEDCNNFTVPDRCAKCIIATKLHYRKTDRFNLINYGINSMTPFIEKTNKLRLLRSNIKNNTNRLREILAYCDHIFVIAHWFKELLDYNGFNSPKISYIPPITEPKKNHTISDEVKMKLVFIGRIEPQKGLHLLCRSMNRVSQKLQLDVFGNIVDERYFKNCKRGFDFNFKGAVPRDILLSKLNDYDFLILPSVFTEMYPLVIQEAMASNLPVIASAAKGNVDVITEGKNGFIFNYDDYKDLASVIDKAYSLKKDGWQPEFEMNDSHESDLKEILSYYS
jgi:glycosyltransferase involved in cell wall biosynthesis